jgi:hypothetical protein
MKTTGEVDRLALGGIPVRSQSDAPGPDRERARARGGAMVARESPDR